VKDKTVMLDNVKERTTPFQREEKRLEKLQNKKRSKVMKAKEQREKNMFKIPEEARKYTTTIHVSFTHSLTMMMMMVDSSFSLLFRPRYEMYVPLHAMWKEYIDSLVGNATGYLGAAPNHMFAVTSFNSPVAWRAHVCVCVCVGVFCWQSAADREAPEGRPARVLPQG
jgi:hypothetical protein